MNMRLAMPLSDGTDGIHFDAASNKNLAIYMGDYINQEIWER